MDQPGRYNDSWARSTTSRSTDALIDAMYEHAFTPGTGCSWCELLARLCNTMDASSGCFLLHDLSIQQASLRHRFNIPSVQLDECNNNITTAGQWTGKNTLDYEGQIIPGGGSADGGRLDGMRLNPDSMKPLLNHIFGVVSLSDNQVYLVGLFRPPDAPPFRREDKALLAQLLPHLKRSRAMRNRLQRDRQMQESLTEMIDRLPLAFLLVQPSGKVEFSNRLAQSMLLQGNGISLSADGHIAARTPGDTAELKRLISEIVTRHENEGNTTMNGHGEHFMISRGPGRLPLVCELHPASRMRAAGQPPLERGVALLIKDPNIDSSDNLTDFVTIYRLTKAEARLTQLLVDGHGLFEAAEKLSITKNTARTHMRNIYSKIGSNRQTDLIRLHSQLQIF